MDRPPPHRDGVMEEGGESVEGFSSPWWPALAVPNTPSSNHGVLGTRGTLDFLSFTIPEMAFVDRLQDGTIFARARVSSPSQADAMICSNDLLGWVFPTGALNCAPFENRGRFGYRQTADIYWQGASKPCGFAARGGNGGTVLVSVSGAGMPFVGDPRFIAPALRVLGARITRLDAAFDDFNGEYVDLQELVYEARIGAFQRGPVPPAIKFIDDLGSGAGSSLYVGAKGRTELCVYEKGKQQGDATSPAIRVEARLWSADRVIPYEALHDPIAVIIGAYPMLSAYLPERSPIRAQQIKRNVTANADEMIDWLSSAAGKSLALLRESAMEVGITDSEILNLITRQGMPTRFASMPEEVVTRRIAEHLQGAIYDQDRSTFYRDETEVRHVEARQGV